MNEKFVPLKVSEKFILQSQEPSDWCVSRIFIVFRKTPGLLYEVYRSYYRRCAEKKFQKLSSGG